MRNLLIAVVALVACVTTAARAEDLELVSVRKIWDHGRHNAFTDLVRFQGRWYCTFREADAHVGGNGKCRVLVSTDGEKWESAALLAEDGIDLRDPKLTETPDGRLMMVMGGSVYEGKKLLGRRPRVAFSKDGVEWTAPEKVLEEGDWLWRVTWHDGVAWGTSYQFVGQERMLALYRSTDGLKYEKVTDLDVPGHPNETTLRFLKDGRMVALVRREAGNRNGWIGVSEKPFTRWKWTEVPHRLGGPNFVVMDDGTIWAGGRGRVGDDARMVIARMTPESYEPVLTLPSGGDCSYPGMVWHDGMLWVSYYSSHEGKSSIYLAKVKVAGRK